ncbi:hypothetical protein D3C81_1910860 [compost metagenome]
MTTNFHLIVTSPQTQDPPVCKLATKITGTVHAIAVGLPFIRHKYALKVGTPVISACNTRPGHVDLSNLSVRDLITTFIQQIALTSQHCKANSRLVITC